MRIIKTIIILAILAIIAILAYGYSGLYNVAVGTGHNPVTEWYIEMFYDRSVAVRAAELEVPGDLNSEARIRAGAGHYKDMCAGCHGFPGQTAANVFEPQPPALYNHREEPAEAFWIIRNGLKGSAMPQHLDHSEEDIWNIVAFLQVLPSMTPLEYEAITAGAEHSHAGGGSHEHEGEPQEEAAPEEPEIETGEGGHSHAAPETPGEVVAAFHHALEEGNREAALALLHEEATILEGGTLETKQEYAAGHLSGDMEFLSQVQTEVLSREEQIGSGQAVVTSKTRMTGTPGGEEVDVIVEGLATLLKTGGGWRIVQITWSPQPAQAKEGEDV